MLGPYYSHIGLTGNVIPQGIYEDIVRESNRLYGKLNEPVFHRRVAWTQVAPGKWTVEVTPPDD